MRTIRSITLVALSIVSIAGLAETYVTAAAPYSDQMQQVRQLQQPTGAAAQAPAPTGGGSAPAQVPTTGTAPASQSAQASTQAPAASAQAPTSSAPAQAPTTPSTPAVAAAAPPPSAQASSAAAVPSSSSGSSPSTVGAQQYMQGQLYASTNQQAAISHTNTSANQVFQAPFQSQQIVHPASVEALRQAAFTGAVQTALPMSPQQIHRLKQLYSASQYAAAAPTGVPPRPTATSLFVDLSPGATPPAINLAQGNITALVFLDSTGAPWPIDAIDNGNPQSFNIQWNKTDNVLLVQAMTAFGQGNLAVRLRGLGPPVMVSLITNTAVENGGVVDYRVDMRIPGFGPNAIPTPVTGLPGPTSPLLLDVLDGIPPTGGRALTVGGAIGQAWLVGDKIYLRTRLTLLSPGWLQTMSSADGTNAYQLLQAPMLLMSDNGKVIQVRVQGL